MQQLADICGFSLHQVSAALNQAGQQSFSDFINAYRVAHSKKLLRHYPGKSVLDVAMESGFNSKTAFYTSFNKWVGESPTSYRKGVGKTIFSRPQ